jgi:gas vesicle protein
MTRKGTNLVSGAALLGGGGLIGAGLALLLSPRPIGKNNREPAATAVPIEGKANEAAYECVESIHAFVACVGVRTEEILRNGANLTQESREQLLTALESARDLLAKLEERLMVASD